MDLTPFKLDIDELVDAYTEEELTTLADMKKVWAAKKFSYIYEARPKINSEFFMQSLFTQAISHMVSEAVLSRRLGGLYCLYCLYETQPYNPCIKIYLSLEELKGLRSLVIEAKRNVIRVVPALIRRMLDKDMFLFGSVDMSGRSRTQSLEDITKLQNRRVQIAYEKLLSNTKIEDYVHMDLGAELDLETLKKMSTEYAKAKELAIREASGTVDVEDIKHLAEKKKLVGNMIENIVGEWDAQKDTFSKQTGITRGNELVAVDEFTELERLLDE